MTKIFVRVFVPIFFTSIHAFAQAADLTPLNYYINASSQSGSLYFDNSEHQVCGGSGSFFVPWNPDALNGVGAGSTCKKQLNDSGTNWPGLIEIIQDGSAVSGNYVYRLPTTQPASIGTTSEGIHTAKFSTTANRLMAAQYPAPQQGGTVKYSAYYKIDSGFNDTEWHLQMQWKHAPVVNNGVLLYGYSGSGVAANNPKIGWGFANIDNGIGFKRQIRLHMREPYSRECDLGIKTFEASDFNLPVINILDNTWVKVTVEIKFNEFDGYVKIWVDQGNGDILVINASDINTHSRLITQDHYDNSNTLGTEFSCLKDGNRYYWAKNDNFSFGVINYHGTHSYLPENLIDSNEVVEDHVILVDDIKVQIPE